MWKVIDTAALVVLPAESVESVIEMRYWVQNLRALYEEDDHL